MMNPDCMPKPLRRGPTALLLLPALLLVASAFAAPLQAQASEDLRWLPWVGCWEPTGELAVEGSELLVCITPDRDGAQVETFVDGESMGVEFLAGDGSRQNASEGGCEGTRQATFADDGRRLFVLSDLDCGVDARRSTRGVFAMGSDGFEWIEIQSISAGDDAEPFLTVRRFHTASRATLARHEQVEPATDRGLAIETARRSAARALDAEALVEASDLAGPAVTAALVAEMGQAFDLNARALRDYRDRGVAPEVLDMMIAMTWPDRFQVGVDGSVDAVAMARAASPRADARYDDRYDDRYNDRYNDRYSSRYCTGWLGRCSSFDAWLAYRYGGFGYGYGVPGYGYRPYGWYTGPRYVVVDPSSVQSRPRGTMTSEGYRPAGSAGSSRARPATTRGTTQPQSAPRPATSSAPTTRTAPSTPATRPTTSSAPPTRPPPRPAQRRGTGGGGGGDGDGSGFNGPLLF